MLPRKEETEKENYELLQQFKAKYGHCNVPISYKDDPMLANFVKHQRSRKERLSVCRKSSKTECYWISMHYTTRGWHRNYQLLKHNKVEHGHCVVPHNYTTNDGHPLGIWVAKQRKIQGGLSEEERSKLDDLGFVWKDARDVVSDRKWITMFERLKGYKTAYGDCLVPSLWKDEDDKKLAYWVSRQRRNYWENQLSQVRIEKLESIGFVWKLREGNPYYRDEEWLKQYQKVVAFKERNNQTWIPKRFPEDNFLVRGVLIKGIFINKESCGKTAKSYWIKLGFNGVKKRIKRRHGWRNMASLSIT